MRREPLRPVRPGKVPTYLPLAGLVLAVLGAAPREGQAQVGSNQVYTAVAPCRIVDTRFAAAGIMAPSVTRTFNVIDGNDLVAQGGAAGGCGIPGYGGSPTPSRPRVKAVMVNLVAVSPQGSGHFVGWASGPAPLASVLNYANVAGLNIANGVVVPLDQDATPGADLRVLAAVSASHLVIDVLGYFTERHPLAGEGRPGALVWGTNADPLSPILCTGASGVRFGLSDAMVDWSDSPAACPAGYWVCSLSERGSSFCNTPRPEGTCDLMSCDGACVNFLTNQQPGAVADSVGLLGRFVNEPGVALTDSTCATAAVWCCTD